MKYFTKIKNAIDSIEALNAYENIKNIIIKKSHEYEPIIFFGNGGSAAIANHAVCDFTKGVAEDSSIFNAPAISLCTNVPLITAIANDIGYEYIFSRQLNYLALKKAVVIAISSSGNSDNVCAGLSYAKVAGYTTIAFTGFSGGKIVKNNLADYNFHVNSDNYGVIEDCHMMILHSLAQDVRIFMADCPDNLKL
jgi:phosphoheptose isomerase